MVPCSLQTFQILPAFTSRKRTNKFPNRIGGGSKTTATSLVSDGGKKIKPYETQTGNFHVVTDSKVQKIPWPMRPRHGQPN